MRTLIKNIDVLTMDQNNTQYKNGCILIEDDKIAFVGDQSQLKIDADYDKMEDGKGKLAMPGFINTHTHVAMTLLGAMPMTCLLWNGWLKRYGPWRID